MKKIKGKYKIDKCSNEYLYHDEKYIKTTFYNTVGLIIYEDVDKHYIQRHIQEIIKYLKKEYPNWKKIIKN